MRGLYLYRSTIFIFNTRMKQRNKISKILISKHDHIFHHYYNFYNASFIANEKNGLIAFLVQFFWISCLKIFHSHANIFIIDIYKIVLLNINVLAIIFKRFSCRLFNDNIRKVFRLILCLSSNHFLGISLYLRSPRTQLPKEVFMWNIL